MAAGTGQRRRARMVTCHGMRSRPAVKVPFYRLPSCRAGGSAGGQYPAAYRLLRQSSPVSSTKAAIGHRAKACANGIRPSCTTMRVPVSTSINMLPSGRSVDARCRPDRSHRHNRVLVQQPCQQAGCQHNQGLVAEAARECDHMRRACAADGQGGVVAVTQQLRVLLAQCQHAPGDPQLGASVARVGQQGRRLAGVEGLQAVQGCAPDAGSRPASGCPGRPGSAASLRCPGTDPARQDS